MTKEKSSTSKTTPPAMTTKTHIVGVGLVDIPCDPSTPEGLREWGKACKAAYIAGHPELKRIPGDTVENSPVNHQRELTKSQKRNIRRHRSRAAKKADQ